MSNFLTYMYLLTPLHTGGSADEGNLMGIAREVHTEFPYLPSSSLRGRIRAAMEQSATPEQKETVDSFFGKKIKDGGQPTEGEVWFADATMLFFPIASLSHHLVWVTCPLWLERWSRWLEQENRAPVDGLVRDCRRHLSNQSTSAVLSFSAERLYLQTAVVPSSETEQIDSTIIKSPLTLMLEKSGLAEHLLDKLVILGDEDCIALVETGLQREVRVALDENSKTVKGGSFRSEEAIPPETVLFFPWGTKAPKKFQTNPDTDSAQNQVAEANKPKQDEAVRRTLAELLHERRLQFGGLEGLGRGWSDLITSTIGEVN